MAEACERLRSVLGKYANLLRERTLALPRHQSHLVRWTGKGSDWALEILSIGSNLKTLMDLSGDWVDKVHGASYRGDFAPPPGVCYSCGGRFSVRIDRGNPVRRRGHYASGPSAGIINLTPATEDLR